MPCETTTNGDSKTFCASSTDSETPDNNSHPVQCFKLRARHAVCATTKSVCQMECIARRIYMWNQLYWLEKTGQSTAISEMSMNKIIPANASQRGQRLFVKLNARSSP